MAQAKTLTQGELDQLLRYVATTRYRVRNRALVLMSFWSLSVTVGNLWVLLANAAVRNDAVTAWVATGPEASTTLTSPERWS